jgi:hypothetical protein
MPTLEELLRRRTYARERPAYSEPVEPAVPLSERWSAVLRLLGQMGGGGIGGAVGDAVSSGASALGAVGQAVGSGATTAARYLGSGIDALGRTFNFDDWTTRLPNARIPLSELTRIDQPGQAPDIFLRPDLAANFLALRREARQAGVPRRPRGVQGLGGAGRRGRPARPGARSAARAFLARGGAGRRPGELRLRLGPGERPAVRDVPAHVV